MVDKLLTIKQEVWKANPEILELKLGCKIETSRFSWENRREIIAYNWNDFNEPIDEIGLVGRQTPIKKEDIAEILGRPIHLADVLLAISKVLNVNAYEIWLGKALSTIDVYEIDVDDNKTGGKMIWNLLKDNLDEQSEECIEFIYQIIK